MPDLTTNLSLIKPLGDEVAELWASNGGAGQAEQNKTIIDSFSARTDLDDYTPVLSSTGTQPNLGSSANIDGRFEQLSNGLVYGWARLQASGTGVSAGSGGYRISLPVAIDETFHTTDGTTINRPLLGNGFAKDNNNATLCVPLAILPAGPGLQSVIMTPHTFAGKGVTFVTSNSPFTLAAGDAYSIRFLYRGVVV